jgi:hypothetical protein
VCVCVREREGEKARKASSVLSFSLPSLPPSKLQFSNPVSPGLPTPPHAGGINGLRSRGHLPPPHPPPSRCGENPNVTRCPRTAPPPSLPPRRRLLRVCSRWGREKKRSLLRELPRDARVARRPNAARSGLLRASICLGFGAGSVSPRACCCCCRRRRRSASERLDLYGILSAFSVWAWATCWFLKWFVLLGTTCLPSG